jgi:hypothetical protein
MRKFSSDSLPALLAVRLLLTVLEAALLRSAVSALLLVLAAAVRGCGRRTVALLLLGVATVAALLRRVALTLALVVALLAVALVAVITVTRHVAQVGVVVW